MAKDGTSRGGARIGAGRKAKSLNDKLSEGKSAKVLNNATADLQGEDVPPFVSISNLLRLKVRTL